MCEEEVLGNAKNVYCSAWEGVMGGRLLCFMVLGTADLSMPHSPGSMWFKNPKQRMCVCVRGGACMRAFFTHPSLCNNIPTN